MQRERIMNPATGAMASLLPKLKELLNKEYKLQPSTKEDVEYLSQQMERIRSALFRTAELQLDHLDERAMLGVKEVKELSNYMEVAVDKLMVVALAPNSEGFKFKGVVEKMGTLLTKGKTRHQTIIGTIKRIKTRVKEVVERGGRFMVYADEATRSFDPRSLSLYPGVKDLVGVHGKKDQELMKLLSDGDNVSTKKLKIICVVGFAGLGKTTLVKAVYDEVEWSFDYKAFVVVGQFHNPKKVFRDIISQLTMNSTYSNTCTLDERHLIEKLREILENKRYLIVIDDIWNERQWNDIKYAFSTVNNIGSRIISTTRIVSVSKACCSFATDSIYQMEPLSNDDSEKLLYNRLFGSVNRRPHEFKHVSSKILKKCGGVPLAIIAMASVLAGGPWMKAMEEWPAFLKSVGGGLTNECWENMQMILSFSYNDLPRHLKTCLLYFSTFPGSNVIERYRLVKKWIAEEIVTEKTKLCQELSLEEVASEYFDELVNRNVIHPLECSNNDEVITYHVHPMMHDFLKVIAKEENFAASLDDIDISSAHGVDFRHLSIDCPDSESLTDLSSMAFGGGVRSLTVFGHANRILLSRFEGIRILDLEGCKSIDRADLEYICSMVLLKRLCLAKTQIVELPPEIGNLQYLEGLDVGATQITELPPQIGKLQHLKTLDARKSQVKELPDQIVWLTRLVHLLIGDSESSEGVKLPDGIGKMRSLQKLCTIDLTKCCTSSLKKLGELPHLKEITVVATDAQKDTRINDSLLSSLDKSTKLRSLVVYSNFRLSTLQSSLPYKYLICRKKLTVVRRFLKVPSVIAGHHFLGMLDIRVCKLEEDDLKILLELPRLQSLIVRLEVLPKEMIHIRCEGFAKLESFYVDCRMPRVTFEEGAMPILEHLELKMYSGSASEEHMDIKNLLSLQKVTLRYSKWYASNKGVRETTEAVKTECKEHPNEITLCIAEEDKDGVYTPKTEIFQQYRVAIASSSNMTEIGKEEDTEDGGLHQSSCANLAAAGPARSKKLWSNSMKL